MTAKVGRLRFEEAAKDLTTEYATNGRDSADELERRLRLHLTPWFGGRRMASISTADVRNYIKKRQADTIREKKAHTICEGDRVVEVPEKRRAVSNGEINRELTT